MVWRLHRAAVRGDAKARGSYTAGAYGSPALKLQNQRQQLPGPAKRDRPLQS